MPSSEWNNTYTGTDTFSQATGIINSNWENENVPGTSIQFDEMYTGGLLELAQKCYVQSGNDVTAYTINFHSGAKVWNDAVFLDAGSMDIDVVFTCKWKRSPRLLDGEIETDVRGGLEQYAVALGQGIDQITSDNDGENPDDSCDADYETDPTKTSGTLQLDFNIAAVSEMAQGGILRVRMVVQTGELWLLGEEDCAGSQPTGGQSVIDKLDVDYLFFHRNGNSQEPSSLYVNGVNPNDEEVLLSGPNFSVNAGEPITVWEYKPTKVWQKVNSSPSTNVSGTVTATPAPMVAASSGGQRYAKWVLAQ